MIVGGLGQLLMRRRRDLPIGGLGQLLMRRRHDLPIGGVGQLLMTSVRQLPSLNQSSVAQRTIQLGKLLVGVLNGVVQPKQLAEVQLLIRPVGHLDVFALERIVRIVRGLPIPHPLERVRKVCACVEDGHKRSAELLLLGGLQPACGRRLH